LKARQSKASRRKISASWCSPCRRISACCWSSWPTVCTTCARCITLSKPEKRQRIARETIEIYAPLAERIGLHNLKEELEDLCFAQLNPEARESISNRLSFLRRKAGRSCRRSSELQKLMTDSGIGRSRRPRKTKYSIWRKMQRKNVSFEQLSDIMAFRIVVENIEQCYGALGIVHSNYPTVPGRFKDYISTPKPNGYRSIHTTVIGPGNHRIEVQIRTRDMQEEADLGVAAHWATSRVKNQSEGCKGISLAARPARNPRAGTAPGGVSREHQARAVPGSGLLLHAQGRSDRAARAVRHRLTSPMPCTRVWVISAWAPRSTAASRR
jgi:hypothetical protein